jgi:3-oxoacyl-[acyl-carrier-protein] synthase-3
MDGPSLISFTVAQVPKVIDQLLEVSQLDNGAIDLFLLHQATRKMLEQLQERLGLTDERLPIVLETCGNTVSSTIPILIEQLRREKRLTPGMRNMLIGFGVGWSWAGCVWEETWQA